MSGAPEHGQFPFGVGFVQAEDVHAPVLVFHFDVAIVTPVPPVDRFRHFDLTPFKMNASGYRDPLFVRMELNANAHFCGP